MKILSALVFAALFCSTGLIAPLFGSAPSAGQSASGLIPPEKPEIMDLNELEASFAAQAAAKTAAGVKPGAAAPVAGTKGQPGKPQVAAVSQAAVKPEEAEQKRGFAVNKKHLVVGGDTLWGLSQKYYQDPFKWGKIYNANINSVENPDLIYPQNELEIPDITEEVKPLAKTEVQPAVQKEPVMGEEDIAKEPELESSEIIAAQEVSLPAAAQEAVKPEAPVPAVERADELFNNNDLSDEMPRDMKEWNTRMKIAGDDWLEDGVVVTRETREPSMEESLSVTGEIVIVKLRSIELVKRGDYLEVYLKGTSAYDKEGYKLGFELQRAGRLKVLSVDGKRARAKVVSAVTAIGKGLLVKKK